MSQILKPVPILALVLAIGMFMFGQTALAGICLFAGFGSLLLSSVRESSTTRQSDAGDIVDPESRTRFIPIKKLVSEIDELVDRGGNSPMMKAIGKEAREEAHRIRGQVGKALVVRGQLRRNLRGRETAEKSLAETNVKLDGNLDELERRELEVVKSRLVGEIDSCLAVDTAISSIDQGLRQAESVLSDIRLRLAVTVGEVATASTGPSEDLRESLSRLKALSLSYDEADEILRES